MSFTYEYPRPSVTSTVLVICPANKTVILGRRRPNAEVFPNWLCIPGGFLIAKHDKHPGDTTERTAQKEVHEELSLEIAESRLRLFGVFSDPETDPRAHVVNVCYWVEISPEEAASLVAGDDICEIIEHDYHMVPELAFNHNDILMQGLGHYFNEAR